MIEKVRSGQPFRPKAADWNAFAEAGNAVRSRAHDLAAGRERWDDGSVLVRNVSDDYLPSKGVCWVSGIAATQVLEVQPVRYGWDTAVAVTAGPIEAGELGRVWVDGVREVRGVAMYPGFGDIVDWSAYTFPIIVSAVGASPSGPISGGYVFPYPGPLVAVGAGDPTPGSQTVMIDLDRVRPGTIVFVQLSDGTYFPAQFIQFMGLLSQGPVGLVNMSDVPSFETRPATTTTGEE